MVDIVHARKILKELGQEQLVQGWNALTERQQQTLLDQVLLIDIPLFNQQRKTLIEEKQEIPKNFEPFGDYDSAGNEADVRLGHSLMAEGKVACLLVAGGQGTRLGHQGPKGTVEVSPVQSKSLFQLFSERVSAASKWAEAPLNLGVMTSEHNEHPTRNFFAGHRCFGLEASRLRFFSQKGLPFLDDKGNIFLSAPGEIAMAPDGNGALIEHFYRCGLWKQWYLAGIRYVTFIQVDNALADPFDAELVGHHFRTGADVTMKACLRQDPREKVGVIVRDGNSMRVVEYTEMAESERQAVNSKGGLKHPCANLSMFCFSMEFLEEVAQQASFPLHLAHKDALCLQEDGEKMTVKAWKFERFIFDILSQARRPQVLVYPREDCFAPLKNAVGNDSLKTVKHALLHRDRRRLSQMIGKKIADDALLELDPRMYYPTQEVLKQIEQGSLRTEGYISPCENVNC